MPREHNAAEVTGIAPAAGSPAGVGGRAPTYPQVRDKRKQGTITYNEAARVAAVARAVMWTRSQAERLDTTPAAILDAIQERAWLPDQIESVSSKYALESPPPPLQGVETWVDVGIDRRASAKAKAGKERRKAA